MFGNLGNRLVTTGGASVAEPRGAGARRKVGGRRLGGSKVKGFERRLVGLLLLLQGWHHGHRLESSHVGERSDSWRVVSADRLRRHILGGLRLAVIVVVSIMIHRARNRIRKEMGE